MTDNYQQPTVNDTNENGDEVPAQPTSLGILFRDQHGSEVHFKLKSTTKLKKAMDAYSARSQVERKTLRFLFEGERVHDEHTPETLGLGDIDIIDVHMEQIGGAVTFRK